MDRRKYYVSVQSGTVMENQGDAAYEFEIEATQDELDQLQELFEMKAEFDNGTFLRSHAAGVPYHIDPDNDGYDETLRNIYALIRKLGTPETSNHIECMDLANIGDWNRYKMSSP